MYRDMNHVKSIAIQFRKNQDFAVKNEYKFATFIKIQNIKKLMLAYSCNVCKM